MNVKIKIVEVGNGYQVQIEKGTIENLVFSSIDVLKMLERVATAVYGKKIVVKER